MGLGQDRKPPIVVCDDRYPGRLGKPGEDRDAFFVVAAIEVVGGEIEPRPSKLSGEAAEMDGEGGIDIRGRAVRR